MDWELKKSRIGSQGRITGKISICKQTKIIMLILGCK